MDGLAVWTVEGMRREEAGEGGEEGAAHPIQTRLVKAGGTQCGFCTPGWCVSMYGLLLEKQQQQQQGEEGGGEGGVGLEAGEVERHFDGNLCRCTGYRPILEAFKSFATTTLEVEGGREGEVGGGSEEGEAEEGGWVKICAGGTGCPHAGEGKGKSDIEDMCSSFSSSSLSSSPSSPSTCPHKQLEKKKGQLIRRCHHRTSSSSTGTTLPPSLPPPPPFPEELKSYTPLSLSIVDPSSHQEWHRVLTLPSLLQLLQLQQQQQGGKEGGREVGLVVGHTGIQGVSKYYNGTFPVNVPVRREGGREGGREEALGVG
jgi:xanthine dehydrogenase/oxidase